MGQTLSFVTKIRQKKEKNYGIGYFECPFCLRPQNLHLSEKSQNLWLLFPVKIGYDELLSHLECIYNCEYK